MLLNKGIKLLLVEKMTKYKEDSGGVTVMSVKST